MKPTHLSLILEEKMKDTQCERFKERMLSGKAMNFSICKDGELKFRNMMFVPIGNRLRKELLKEAHQGHFSLHLGSIKTYQDLKESYWWLGMKREILEYVSTCFMS